MIDRLSYLITDETNPYKNLALEEYLTMHTEAGECILYLWQNRHTVVIGKNQNCWKECKINYLEEDGGFLARRLSGGGAVFHDLGNLNFTFMARSLDYDVDKQLETIAQAVRYYGINAVKTGRNDIEADGKKFSGNAFYQSGDFCYHHGTILLDVDTDNMSKYLNVSREKLQSKSVASVKSRVTNLCEYMPGITAEGMKKKLLTAFSSVYGQDAVPLSPCRIEEEQVKRLEERYASWEWKYGRKIPFNYEIKKRFTWGDAEIQLCVNEGKITEINAFSDAIDTNLIESLPSRLVGCRYEEHDMVQAVSSLCENTNSDNQIKGDLIQLIREHI